ncbi:Cdc25 [Trypoxylus dichotomus]
MLWDLTEGCSVCERSSNSVYKSGRCCGYNEEGFEKENMQECAEMKQANEENDLSLYENSATITDVCDGSPSHCLHQLKRRRPLEDLDNNSQDSGYGTTSFLSHGNKFLSPKKSLNSHTSGDYDFYDICGLEDDDENARLPGEFIKLISGSLMAACNSKKSPVNFARPLLKHSVSLNESTSTSNMHRIRSCLFKKDDEVKCFKRPEPPTEIQSPKSTKRSKNEIEKIKPRHLMRSISLPPSEDIIKSALQRSSDEPDLIGDFSKQFCLPLIPGKHPDLKSISPATLALLVKGHFEESIANYKIIDCRYPYEYNGGHIRGAFNFFTKKQIFDELLNIKVKTCCDAREQEDTKRDILVFHCEFSSERGPNLSRFLRQVDRRLNNNVYPYLHYPEVYLLDGGYKNFYKQFSELCIPKAYLPMLHPNFENDLKHFRTKSKTFNVDARCKSNNTRSLSFRRL